MNQIKQYNIVKAKKFMAWSHHKDKVSWYFTHIFANDFSDSARTNLILYILMQFHDSKHVIVPELTNYQCAPIFWRNKHVLILNNFMFSRWNLATISDSKTYIRTKYNRHVEVSHKLRETFVLITYTSHADKCFTSLLFRQIVHHLILHKAPTPRVLRT